MSLSPAHVKPHPSEGVEWRIFLPTLVGVGQGGGGSVTQTGDALRPVPVPEAYD